MGALGQIDDGLCSGNGCSRYSSSARSGRSRGSGRGLSARVGLLGLASQSVLQGSAGETCDARNDLDDVGRDVPLGMMSHGHLADGRNARLKFGRESILRDTLRHRRPLFIKRHHRFSQFRTKHTQLFFQLTTFSLRLLSIRRSYFRIRSVQQKATCQDFFKPGPLQCFAESQLVTSFYHKRASKPIMRYTIGRKRTVCLCSVFQVLL